MRELWTHWKNGLEWLSNRFPPLFVFTGIIAVTAYIIILALKAMFGVGEDNIGYVFALVALVIVPVAISKYGGD